MLIGVENDTSWLNAKDLIQTSFLIRVRNNTSGIYIQPEKDIELVEIAKNGFSMKLPSTACAVGQFLQIQIRKIASSPLRTEPPTKQTMLELAVTGAPLVGLKCVPVIIMIC